MTCKSLILSGQAARSFLGECDAINRSLKVICCRPPFYTSHGHEHE